ncbi:hypothetical protein BJV77DRAFT_1069876 [Russula vinacea]|nr:hypothetical protein BJV77DRAFT_1069876 [Russula vinacea]
MDLFETDYSNLFAAGLRGIQSRPTGRSTSEPQLGPAVSSSTGSAARDEDVKRAKEPTIPPRFGRPSFSPRDSGVPPHVLRGGESLLHPRDIVEETSLNLRILDWSVRVSNATAFLDDEDDECVDPYLFDKVDPVDVPASTRTKILVTLPTSPSSGEQFRVEWIDFEGAL